MSILPKVSDLVMLILSLICLQECTKTFEDIDPNFHLVTEAYGMAKNLFNQGRMNYNELKNKSLHTVDTFLDLVQILNEEMGKELRSSIIKFYKIKYFHDFTNYVIALDEDRLSGKIWQRPEWRRLMQDIARDFEEHRKDLNPIFQMIDIVEHCLVEPVEKRIQIQEQFHHVIKNFEDVRQFDTINKCHKELADEVAVTHCILHQAVLFNETMQDTLIRIVEIKTRQHAKEMSTSLYNVQSCLRDFVPKFFDQLLLGAFTDDCGYMKVVNASIIDLMTDNWRGNMTFLDKWSPLVKLLKDRPTPAHQTLKQDLRFRTLFNTNLSLHDAFKTLY